MKKIGLLKGILVIGLISVFIMGCTKREASEPVETGELTKEVKDSVEELYSVQINYANGTAPLNIIPSVVCQNVYDNWDAIEATKSDMVPIMLREYVDPDIVFFDYDTEYSIKWNKETGDVMVEKTDIDAREDYKQKEHK